MKATLLVTMSRLFYSGCIFLLNSFLARHLAPSDFGTYSAALVYLNLAALFLIGGCNTSHIYFYKHGQDYFWRLIKIYTAPAVFFFIIGVFFWPAAFFAAGAAAIAGISIVNADAQARENHFEFSAQLCMFGLCVLGGMIAVELLAPHGPLKSIYLYALFCAIFYFALIVVRRCISRVTLPHQPTAKAFFGYGAKSLWLNVLGQILYMGDIILLSVMLPSEDVAIYSVASMLAKSLWLIIDSMGLTLFPKLINISSFEAKHIFKKGVIQACLLCLGPAIIFLFFGRLLLRALYSDNYLSAYEPTLVLIVAAFPLIFYKLGSRLAAAREDWRAVYISLGISILANIVLNLLLVPIFGIIGSALASLLSYSMCGLYLAWSLGVMPKVGYK